MKARILVIVAALLFTQAAMAQLSFGIKGGANITKVAGKAYKDEFKYGYHLGGFVTINLPGSRFAIQPEVLFNQYQTRTDSNFSSVYTPANIAANSKDIKLNYLTIPLLLNFKVANILSLQAGPQYGILIDQDKNILQNGGAAFKNGEFSLLGGVQLNLSKLRLQGRYFVGLNNISDVSDQNKWNNEGFQVSLGLAF